MTNSKYDNYFYFRAVADEDDDDDSAASVMLPVNKIQGMGPTGTTTLTIYFESERNEVISDTVALTVTAGKMKKVIHSLVSAMNRGPHSDGVTVIADDVTTDYDGTTRSAVYIHPDISAMAAITIAAANS